MNWIVIGVILLAWGVLLAVMFAALMKRDKCPECGGEQIQSVDLRTSTIEVEGETIPAAWMYRRCRDCGARLKWDIGENKWVELDPGEWNDVVDEQASR
ncbi:MAG: hypothetical protein ACQEVA_19725 [Myxococcota bacterium]